MTNQRFQVFLKMFTLGVIFLCSLQALFAFAGPRFYSVRSNRTLLPTGCQLGFGPQYRSFEGFLGQIRTVNGRQTVDFNPIQICKAATKICLSQLPGPSCCLNACRQNNSDIVNNSQGKITLNQDDYLKCTQKCVGAPSFESDRLKRLKQLEAKIELRYQNKK